MFLSFLLIPNPTSFLIHFLLPLSSSLYLFHCFLSRFAANVDAKDGKEGKEWKEANKEGKDIATTRSVSVMSSLSYRKRSNIDSIGGKGDALFSALKETAEDDTLSYKSKSKNNLQDDAYSVSSRRKSQVADDSESVISQAYSDANSRARKGMDSRWSDFDKESTVSYTAPSRASTRMGFSPGDDAKSTISLGLLSPLSRRKSTSRLDEERTSPCFSRRSAIRSPGSVSRADSLSRSCHLSEFDFEFDDSRSVAFTERSAYSPHSSTGRSASMPPPQGRSSTLDNEPMDIKTVSHRNYLDPDLEKAINEVLSFKPIKFKRTSLEDSEEEADKTKNDDARSVNGDVRPASSLRRSASAVDCLRSTRSSSSASSHRRSKSKNKGKKKKRSQSSGSDSSDDHRRSSSKRRSKKSKKKSKKRDVSSSSSSSDSESDSESDSGSGASTVSYRSSSSIKKAPNRKSSSPEQEGESARQNESPPPQVKRKDEKKRKKKVDSLVMKYLYRPDSD